jgi:hypothetical protein
MVMCLLGEVQYRADVVAVKLKISDVSAEVRRRNVSSAFSSCVRLWLANRQAHFAPTFAVGAPAAAHRQPLDAP